MGIRPARPEDYGAVGELTVRAYAGVYPEEGRDELTEYEKELRDVAGRAAGSEILVATDDGGEIVGAVTYVPGPNAPAAEFDDPDTAGIRMLAVSPAAQGRGLGEALTLACIDRARAAGRTQIFLYSTQWMTVAHRLYLRLGFERDPADDWEYGAGFWLWAFRLHLDAPRP